MMLPPSSGASLAAVSVVTTSNKGHDAAFWADRAVEKIMQVADTAPMPIREQAIAFKDRMREVILHYMHNAIASDRTTVCNIVSGEGRPDLVDVLRS